MHTLNTGVNQRSPDWYKGHQAIYLSEMDANSKTAQHCHFSSIASFDTKPDIKPVLLYDNTSDIDEYCYIMKSRYRFWNLEVYTHINVINFIGI